MQACAFLALLIAPASALLQSAPLNRGAVLRPAASLRGAGVVMGEQSTRRQNEWKYVKGINDYGKEQTYMYLAEREGSEEDFMGTPLVDLGAWSFLVTPYYFALFVPLPLCFVLLYFGPRLGWY